MPSEFTPAPQENQPIKFLPDRPLSRKQRWRRQRLADQLGVPIDKIPDRRGYHDKHPKGPSHPRWNDGRMISEHGYAKVRVGVDHPLADPNGYTYEHLLVWVAAGRDLPGPGEVIHHKDEVKTNNRIDNLELKTRPAHGADHIAERDRDALGRVLPKAANPTSGTTSI